MTKRGALHQTRPAMSVPAGAVLPLLPALILAFTPPGASATGYPTPGALAEVNRIRSGFGIDGAGIEDIGWYRTRYGRHAQEIEGWRIREGGEKWPVDQATYDDASGLLAKYVIFGNISRRRSGESILPMSTVSTQADGYLALFYPSSDLSLESIDRYREAGQDRVYYELRYSPHPQEVVFFDPLVKLLVDASTGKLYRFEMAVDYLSARYPPKTMIGSSAAEKIARVHLSRIDMSLWLGRREEVRGVFRGELFFVRPNSWFGATIPRGGKAIAAWVVPFRTGEDRGETPHLLFVEAESGRVVGGLRARLD